MTTFVGFPNAATERQKCKELLQNFVAQDKESFADQLREIAHRRRRVLEISIDDILDYSNDVDFATNVAHNTLRYVQFFEEEAEMLVPKIDVPRHLMDVFDILQHQRERVFRGIEQDPNSAGLPKSVLRRFEVQIIPSDTNKPKRLREIKAADIGHLVNVTGMITRVSDVKPHVVVATYTCDVCSGEIYQEVTGNSFIPLEQCPSKKCQDNKTPGSMHMQTRGTLFVKYQELRIQELPDQVPVGHIPRSMTVHCRGEQTRLCGPGDLVTVSGIFLTVRTGGYKAIVTGLQADTYLEATQIVRHKLSYGDLTPDSETTELVRSIATDPDPYGRLAGSIAPEIFGHADLKKALLLQLVGGSSRVLPDGMKIRGDINICLMGDPGIAKSQLLRYIASVSPRGVYTTGKGSSGVGLTAAVVRDNVTGEMSLEGGALVLADMGICCIDEFDKMLDADRAAIHEVMEQQTISIAKAGITTTLNARAAILAAANPLYGRYNRKKTISENVDLPNSLLSRFDLLFLILDKADMEQDISLSRHVLYVHKFLRNPDQTARHVSPAVMKQYIAVARTFDPVVPEELGSYIVEAYVSLRAQDSAAAQSHSRKHADQTMMTARQLLSILRLSQALARLRLSNTISHEDVDEAIRLTHASKSSLLDDDTQRPQEDAISTIFSIIRDYASTVRRSGTAPASGNSQLSSTDGGISLSYAQVEAMVVKKGYSSQQLKTCLQEYDMLGVLTLDADQTHILLDS